jgi:thiosulfate/3-mercaptopyruvate sulfurtransferase
MAGNAETQDATAATEPLVSPDWVAARLESDEIRLVEVDEDTSLYDTSHVPGAVALHWQDDLQDGVRRGFISQDAFGALMDAKGIGIDTHVVLYGGNNNWFAAYAYWYFKLYGHERVSLVDGGRKRWELEDRPMTAEVPDVKATAGYTAAAPVAAIRARRDQVLSDYVGAPRGTALIDVRSPAEFSGEASAPPHLPQENAQVRGHIPGAVNIPWSTAVDPETGSFLTTDRLREIYGDAVGGPDTDVVAYCRIGERSAHTWFVLHELLGYGQVRNYDGSWTEYGSLVDVPVERG